MLSNPQNNANILDLKLALRSYLMNGLGIYGV